MYRMQVYDGQTTGMHWQRRKVAASTCESGYGRRRARIFGRCKRLTGAGDGGDGRRSHPSAASAGRLTRDHPGPERTTGWKWRWSSAPIQRSPSPPLPTSPEVEEFVIAGFLRQQAVDLVKCETVDLEVPANAEIVLEGYVELDELRMEGPFGDHTGFYTMEEEYPVFHLTCITHRKEPVYAATIVGKPPMEDAWMGKAVERIFLPLMKLTIPEIVDVNLPVEGVFHNLMIVSIRKSYAGQARKVMHGIWSLGQAMFTSASS